MSALIAFEAAARLGSMSEASDELHVTQSAVSKRIRSLEYFLRQPLFERVHREIKLTAHGKLYYEKVSGLLLELEHASRNAAGGREKITVRFVGYHSFNMRWLIPRLSNFYSHYPDIQVEISADNRPLDLKRNSADCAIRTGRSGVLDGMESRFVAPIEFSPVARPRKSGDPPLYTVSDLARNVLIVSATRVDIWQKWLQLAGYDELEPSGWVTFDHGSYCYKAAIEGVGVAMGESIMVESDIRAGRLYHPFLLTYRDELSYYFVHPEHPKPGVKEFGEWLVGQAGA